ncbi:hypothetical protein L1Q21_14845, partial [Klebsiella pneumoniae]
VCGKKIGPDPRNFNQRVSLGRNDLLIRTFLNGKTVLYNFTSLFDSLPDGTLACKAANKFMLQK